MGKLDISSKIKNLGRKKTVFLAIGVILVIALAAGGIYLVRSNQNDEPTLEEIVSEKLSAYKTDIADSLSTLNSNDKVADYLVSWAANKDIKTERDWNNNVIYSIKASSKDYKENKPVIIACEYDAADMENYLEPMATALTVAKNAKYHGAFKVVFMPRENGEMKGAESLSEEYMTKDTQLFFLGASSSSKVSITTGGYKQFAITDSLKTCAPTHDKAYKITIKHVPSQDAGYAINPIKTLGNLLANFKSTSLLFELSSFTGGKNADTMPSRASVTVVISSSDEEKFCTRMDKAIEKFDDKYAGDYPEISYTYKEAELPNTVFTKKETENIISLMYTALNGVYYKDDDGNVTAVTNIGKIRAKGSSLSILVSAMSSSADLLMEICDAYKTIAGLCDVKSCTVNSYSVYSGGGKASALLDQFESSFLAFTGDSEMIVEDAVETTPCSVFCNRDSGMAMLYCGITDKTKEKFAGSLITFLDNTNNV